MFKFGSEFAFKLLSFSLVYKELLVELVFVILVLLFITEE